MKDNKFVVGYVVFDEREDHYRVTQVSPQYLKGMACDIQAISRSCTVLYRTMKSFDGSPNMNLKITNLEWLEQ